jgi:hypothetical protein
MWFHYTSLRLPRVYSPLDKHQGKTFFWQHFNDKSVLIKMLVGDDKKKRKELSMAALNSRLFHFPLWPQLIKWKFRETFPESKNFPHSKFPLVVSCILHKIVCARESNSIVWGNIENIRRSTQTFSSCFVFFFFFADERRKKVH